MSRELIYAHDPMCSWCWAFRPTWAEIEQNLPADITVKRLLGGLAPDSQEPMPEQTQAFLQDVWRTIETRVPGTRFNYAFWTDCKPRRSTYPACRAVIAARRQDTAYEQPMIDAIQLAYYQNAQNPSDTKTLVALAAALGLDAARFEADLDAPDTQAALMSEIQESQALGLKGFPSLALRDESGRVRSIRYDYNDPSVVLAQL